MKFPHFPVTLVTDTGTYVALSAHKAGMSWVVSFSDQDAITIDIGTVQNEDANLVRFLDVANRPITIRPTVDADAEAADNHPFFPKHPLPVEIIGAIMNGIIGPTHVYAAVDDDGDVHTLLLFTDIASYARYSRAWQRVTSPEPLSGLRMMEIDEMDVEMYDQADENGRMLTASSFTPLDQIGAPAPPVIAPPRSATVTASGLRIPIIASADDIPAAVEYANEQPEARWFVERRARALGWTTPMPWEA